MKNFTRRRFLINSSAVAALTGCGINSPTPGEVGIAQFSGKLCDDRRKTGPLRIDMHCHFLNLQDLSAGPFVARRAFNFDETDLPGVDALVGMVVGSAAEFLKLATKATKTENGNLGYELKKDAKEQPFLRDPEKFCQYGKRYQKGPFKTKNSRQLTGVFSNKVRNAARIAEVYPSIDIFMPSMVDLYDDRSSMQSITQQIAFYERLNLVTGGRYLPMVSFNPQRQYEDNPDYYSGPRRYLSKVKEAIETRGFVGVKMHPSSGFSPLNNLRYGCVNTATQIVTENDQELYDRFVAYDAMLDELYTFCGQADVPIMTHGSTGITSNRRCMRGPRGDEKWVDRPFGKRGTGDTEWRYLFRRFGRTDGKDSDMPLDWTNSPEIWNQVSEKYGVKVVLSHFSDGLKVEKGTKRVGPSPWLLRAVQMAEKNSNIYIDLSIITEFFVEDDDGVYQLRQDFLEAFKRLVKRYPRLRKKLIYGTDWHMPATARMGAEFLPLVEKIIVQSGLGSELDNIMGARSVELFGLRRGRKTRRRLDEFYAKRGRYFTGRDFTRDDIDWMQKLG